MAEGALSGLRVLELSRFAAGPYCGKFLSGCGAEVIKVEPPDGEPLRKLGPFKDGVPNPETSAPFLFLNTGKKSLTLDVTVDSGREIFLELVAKSDVLVTDWEPALVERHRLDYASLETVNPRLVLTAISFFGQTGPYRDYVATELIGLAMGGYLYITGHPGEPPVKIGGNVGQYQGGLHGAVGTMAAVLHQQLGGEGQLVDVSITESLYFEAGSPLRWLNSGQVSPRDGNRLARGNPRGLYPATVLPCKDGWVHVHEGHGRSRELALLMEAPRIAEPDLLAEPYGHADLIDELCLPWLSQHDKFEVTERAQELRLPFAEVLDIPEILEDPQFAARGYIAEVDHPLSGVTKQPGFLFQASETPWQTARAPLLGEHNVEVLTGLLDYTTDDLRVLRERQVI
jgi:crotonobetainyl-CoA:carnitine CoA-transferase CaiB-like acyl-CoA transferase